MSSQNLVIVESPVKARTIKQFLGKDYDVKSSFGHIRDLPKKGLSIDKEHDFEPLYEIPADKQKIVRELKKDAKTTKYVWLASDEDREGEAIAWHLTKALQLKPATTKRIVFHEITKTAIKHAIANPRAIDIDLVNAQQARRVLDRLVGYELSPILWKKVQPGLSAGRVQSVAVRLIVEREREILSFKPASSFKITAELSLNGQVFAAELNKNLKNEQEVKDFLEACKQAKLSVNDVSHKPSQRNPSAPFTTSTLQQEAARKLSFSVKQTMALAQRLYEHGHITYMRTDSTNISKLALGAAGKYINKTYGPKYYKARQFQTSNALAQEAHEAIRPTNVNTLQSGENDDQNRLYQLIWKRLIASQMAAAQTVKTEVTIAISNRQEQLIVKGDVLQFDGYLKVYGGGKEDAILPKLQVGDNPSINYLSGCQTFSRPPARYSEASLVKKLEELGIGRPSTYASIINTIQSRGYVNKTDVAGEEREIVQLILKKGSIVSEKLTEQFGFDRNKLVPTHLADVTTDFLVKYFQSIIDTGFTASVEKQLDEIAKGKLVWQKAIKAFDNHFHPLIEKTANVSRHETSQARLLGKDPKNGEPIYARFGRYGPMLQRGEVEDKTKKPDFAPLPSGARLESVNLEQALNMFSLPRAVGKTKDGQEIKASIGRFGPYIQVGEIFVSIKPLDPFSISETEARQLYQDKLEAAAKRNVKTFKGSDIQILRGPYGPYVTNGTKNARIPKTTKPESLNQKQAEELLAKAKTGKKRYTRRHK